MQIASSKGINIWCCCYWLQCYTEFIMDFWLLKKGQWNLAIPRTVLERDCSSWMGPDNRLPPWRDPSNFLWKWSLLWGLRNNSNRCCQQTQLLVTIDESAVNKMCVHGISALVIYAKGCWIQRHRFWDSMKKKKSRHTSLCILPGPYSRSCCGSYKGTHVLTIVM